MARQSPLLRKVRSKKGSKFSIPKKGRIRIVLLLVMIGLGVKFLYLDPKNEKVESTAQKNSTDSTAVIVKDSTKADSTVQKKTSKKEPSIDLDLPSQYSINDVKQILKRLDPRLKKSSQVVTVKGRKIRIHYSVKEKLQNELQQMYKTYNPKYGAFVAIEPETGRVIAAYSYTRDGEINHGNKLYLRSIFPAASIFKVVTTAAAIEKSNMRGKSMLKTVGNNHTLYKSQLSSELKKYELVSLEKAFAKSINPVYGRIGQFVLEERGLIEYAHKFGFNAPIPFELDNETPKFVLPKTEFAVAEAASGFNDVTEMSPLFGAMLMAGLSNEGMIMAPTLVDSVVDIKSNLVIYTKNERPLRMPLDEKFTAEEMCRIMSKVAEYGTARNSFRYIKKSFRFKECIYGGKTGNVDKKGLGRVDWFTGFCRHNKDPRQHIAVGVVTVHDENWTVHSGFLGAELMRKFVRQIQIDDAEKAATLKKQRIAAQKEKAEKVKKQIKKATDKKKTTEKKSSVVKTGK